MFRRGDDDRSVSVMNVKKKAFQLGMEVGENNHVDNVGWVRAELVEIKAEAERLGAWPDVNRKYLEGKKLGAARRQRHTVGGQAIGRTTDAGHGHPARPEPVPASRRPASEGAFVERISPEQGLKSTISVMKFVAKDKEVKKDLNGLFAGIFDIQERLLEIEPDPDRRKTFERCLDLLMEVGWIENCDLAFFDEQRAVVTLRSTTAIADAFGGSDEPMCQPICNLLETIGRKTFQKSVAVTEIECVAQGRPACKFEISPRKRQGQA